MHVHNLTQAAKTVRVVNATAAGTTVINGTGVERSGFESVRAVGLFGALTATQTTALKLQESNDNGGGDPYADIANSQTTNMLDGDSNKILITDKFRPAKNWVRAVVVRGTANAVIDGVILELYRASDAAIVADGTVSQQTVIGPNPSGFI